MDKWDRLKHSRGYVWAKFPDGTKKLEHVAVAELALGKVLPIDAEVHHVNSNREDNRPENLVICPDTKYHVLLHVRTEALDASGDANKRRCAYCKTYDNVESLMPHKKLYRHKACHAKYEYARKH